MMKNKSSDALYSLSGLLFYCLFHFDRVRNAFYFGDLARMINLLSGPGQNAKINF